MIRIGQQQGEGYGIVGCQWSFMQHQVHPQYIMPGAGFIANLFIQANIREPAFPVESNTSGIGLRDAGICVYEALLF